MRQCIFAGVIYFLIALFTYGWTYWRACQTINPYQAADHGGAQACGLLLGISWPIYWTLKGAREGLRP